MSSSSGSSSSSSSIDSHELKKTKPKRDKYKVIKSTSHTKNPKQYKIIKSMSQWHLEQQVNDHIKRGWKLFGYMTIDPDKYADSTGDKFNQPMIK